MSEASDMIRSEPINIEKSLKAEITILNRRLSQIKSDRKRLQRRAEEELAAKWGPNGTADSDSPLQYHLKAIDRPDYEKSLLCLSDCKKPVKSKPKHSDHRKLCKTCYPYGDGVPASKACYE